VEREKKTTVSKEERTPPWSQKRIQKNMNNHNVEGTKGTNK
jgi:hypothetical protein